MTTANDLHATIAAWRMKADLCRNPFAKREILAGLERMDKAERMLRGSAG